MSALRGLVSGAPRVGVRGCQAAEQLAGDGGIVEGHLSLALDQMPEVTAAGDHDQVAGACQLERGSDRPASVGHDQEVGSFERPSRSRSSHNPGDDPVGLLAVVTTPSPGPSVARLVYTPVSTASRRTLVRNTGYLSMPRSGGPPGPPDW